MPPTTPTAERTPFLFGASHRAAVRPFIVALAKETLCAARAIQLLAEPDNTLNAVGRFPRFAIAMYERYAPEYLQWKYHQCHRGFSPQLSPMFAAFEDLTSAELLSVLYTVGHTWLRWLLATTNAPPGGEEFMRGSEDEAAAAVDAWLASFDDARAYASHYYVRLKSAPEMYMPDAVFCRVRLPTPGCVEDAEFTHDFLSATRYYVVACNPV